MVCVSSALLSSWVLLPFHVTLSFKEMVAVIHQCILLLLLKRMHTKRFV